MIHSTTSQLLTRRAQQFLQLFVEADAKGAKVELAGGVEGYIRAADLTNEVAAGDVVEAKYTGVDRKARIVHLSVKAKDQAEEAAAVANVNTKQEDVAIPNAMAEAFKH